MKICGPKLSLCGVIISAWGIIMLALLGVFLYIKSPGLVEDIALDEKDVLTSYPQAFHRTAMNCWIAAGLYVVTLLFSLHQFHANSRATYQV